MRTSGSSTSMSGRVPVPWRNWSTTASLTRCAMNWLCVSLLSAVPASLLVAGVTLVVVSVEVVGSATVWVLERASDGVRISLRTAGQLAKGVVVSAGTVVTVSVIGAGVVLSAAGEAIAFIPNEIGKALLYNEQVSR